MASYHHNHFELQVDQLQKKFQHRKKPKIENLQQHSNNIADKVPNSNFAWHKMTFEFDSKGGGIYDNTVSVKEPLGEGEGMSVLAHIQRSPPPPLLSCLCRERVFWFYSEAFDLVLSVCWQPFKTVLQVQAFTNQAQVGQGKGVSGDDTNVWSW